MIYQNVTVIIPPQLVDDEECYSEVVEYVGACTGLRCIRDDPQGGDGVSCEAYFEDDKGGIWHGQLCYPPFPDGSQKYTVDLERGDGEPPPGHP